MKTRTIDSKQVWQSPDRQKTIWEVILEADGKQYMLKTYSPKISQVGFEGEVESYESQLGDRFVKQAPKPSSDYRRDDSAIRGQWAIGQAIAYASSTKKKDEINLNFVEEMATELFTMVDRVRSSALKPHSEAHGIAESGQHAEGRTAKPAANFSART